MICIEAHEFDWRLAVPRQDDDLETQLQQLANMTNLQHLEVSVSRKWQGRDCPPDHFRQLTGLQLTYLALRAMPQLDDTG